MKKLGKKTSQLKDVLAYLKNKRNDGITSLEAFQHFHITRLAAVIYELRRYGYEIETEIKTGKNEYGTYNYAVYRLVNAE